MKKIEFDQDKFTKFKEDYNNAIREGAESFFFDGNQLPLGKELKASSLMVINF